MSYILSGKSSQNITCGFLPNLTLATGQVVILLAMQFPKSTHYSTCELCLFYSTAYLDCIVNQFSWAGKPAKIHKEISAADIKYSGLKEYNFPLFISTLILSWEKRYLQSSSKGTFFPEEMDLPEAFKYGPD